MRPLSKGAPPAAQGAAQRRARREAHAPCLNAGGSGGLGAAPLESSSLHDSRPGASSSSSSLLLSLPLLTSPGMSSSSSGDDIARERARR